MYEKKNSGVMSGLVLLSSWRWVCLIAALSMLGAGCAGGGGSMTDLAAAPVAVAAVHSASGYTLEVLPETYLGAPAHGEFRLAVDQRAKVVTVRVLGEGLQGLRAIYARLHCPAGMNVDTAQAGSGLGAADDVLSLCHTAPGVVELGAVLKHYDKCKGVDGSAELARITLRAGTAQAQRQARVVSARTIDHPVLYVNCSQERIVWESRLAGDYNQDGAVGIADLTPLALHWGETGDAAPADWGLTGTSFPVDSIQQVLDTSGDAVINLADLTATGANYGARIAAWSVYRSTSPATDFPDVDLDDPAGDGTAQSKIARIAYREFSELAVGDPAKERLRFSIPLAHLTGGMAYWVRPVEAGVEGVPSNWSPYEKALPAKFSLVVEVETKLFDPGIILTQDVLTLGPEQVVCQVNASNATTAQCLVFRTHFDNLEFNPKPFTTSPLVGDAAGARLWLAGPRTPTGVAKFSNAPNTTAPVTTLAGDFSVVRCVFQREAQPASMSPIVLTSSSPSLRLAFEPGTAKLSWYFGRYADAGQDGDVWIDDFATLNYYFGKPADDPLSASYIADLGRDGTVTIMDLGTLGANYSKSFSSYNVYTGIDPEDDSSAVLIGNVPLSAATGDPMVDRLRFSFAVPDPQPGWYLWVQPERDGYVAGIAGTENVQIP